MKTYILLSMIFCHTIDDYYHQGWLASAKQRSWWEKNAPNSLYRYDYIMTLFMHSFSWSFMIMLVPVLITKSFYPLLFLINVAMHMYIDDQKANKKTINLVTDQTVHLLQILCTWYVFMF